MWEGLTKKMRQKKTKKKFFPECLPWHSGKRPFPECQNRALGEEAAFPECQGRRSWKNFCFFFLPHFLWGLPTLFKTPCSNLGQFWLFLLYFVSFFVSLNFFAYFEFELQVHEIIEFGDSKNYINNIWCMLRPYPGTRMKCRASCWRNMTNNLREKCF